MMPYEGRNCFETKQECAHDCAMDTVCFLHFQKKETINHPAHYGGADNTYEAIKVIEAWQLNFNLGNTVKYISRAGKKGAALEDLKKSRWYLDREIANMEKQQ